MAVSFKVPKSPKRDIFAIDTFQGVDFSNTETSIEPSKSPNAENMVRLVPGKVRKRTGYKTEILFSDDVDINRAIDSSEDYKFFDVTGTTAADGTVISKFYDIFAASGTNYVRFEVEFIGSYQFVRYPNAAESAWEISNTTDEPEEVVLYTSDALADAMEDIRVYRTAPAGDNDFLRVRKVMVCHRSSHDAEDLIWSQAPEDKGIKYVNRGSIDPVYGSHILKSYDVNRVANVNRALDTSDTFESFNVSSTETTIYSLGDFLFADSDRVATAYVEFDYTSDIEAILHVGAADAADHLEDTTVTPPDPSDPPYLETRHYSTVISNAGGYWPGGVTLRAVGLYGTVQIKNLSVMYEKNNSYAWSPAPEDVGNIFHIEDLYLVEPNNYAAIFDYYQQDNSTSLVATSTAIVGTPSSHVVGYAKVTFDIETSTSEEIDTITLEIQTNAHTVYQHVFTEQLGGHFELYLPPYSVSEYIEAISVQYNLATTDAACITYIKNIKLQKIRLRDTFSIYARDYLYHVGKDFYIHSSVDDLVTKVYSDANQHKSQSWQLDDKLAIVDGKDLYLYTFGQSVEVLDGSNTYIPLVTVSKEPAGGGTQYESLNMLQPGFYETFVVLEKDKNEVYFHLSFENLDATTTKAWVLNASGDWIEKTEGVHYTVDRTNGIIKFVTAPGKSPIDGEDNVKVLAYRTVDGYRDRVAKCTTGVLFGVGGAADRIFLSGNPDKPNWDFYSKEYDPTYFPDTGYSVLGSATSAVVGYAIVNSYLATFKDEHDPAQNVIIREGDMIVDDNTKTSEPAFKIINTLQGNGVVAPYSFAYLQTEPLFLTHSGICAITPLDITGERYSQNRSFFLNGRLTKEEGLEGAVATIFNDQYVLALNRQLYILDGLQPIRTDKSMPYSTRQYAAFHCTSVPASCIWVADNSLMIGTYGGKICRFATDTESLESYNDDGEPIYCCWETPELDGQLFYKNKTFRYFAIRIMSALRTSVRLSAHKPNKDGPWMEIKEDETSGTLFNFNLIDFTRFSFRTDTSAKVSHTKIRIKKVDKAKFRVENDRKNEPFGLYDLALEYIESGNFKG